ncbi:FCD domain-containing protein [Pseudomonas syringae]|nr:FCD domain-containing protein [Pseudomonas syringae]MCF5068688.1 FCD domain-containing protein [Pseudomonas syringae]
MNSLAMPQPNRQSTRALPFSRLRASVDDLYPRVFDAILDQRIDTRFTEESLGQMFNASRTDIRRVLTQLSHQQIVVLRANHRPRLADVNVEQTRQTLHARRLTETMLVHLASQQPRADDVKRLRTLIERERQAAEQHRRGAAIRLSGEFHLRLAEMAGNAPLAHFLGSLVPLTSLAIARCDADALACCAWREHVAIVGAVECRDVAKATLLLNRHLDNLGDTLLGCVG